MYTGVIAKKLRKITSFAKYELTVKGLNVGGKSNYD